jgi:hypothetical protein
VLVAARVFVAHLDVPAAPRRCLPVRCSAVTAARRRAWSSQWLSATVVTSIATASVTVNAAVVWSRGRPSLRPA